jgi:hypothetical protein
MSTCSPNFNYSDFFKCSVTQASYQLSNQAKDSRTLDAIQQICLDVLEPVVKQFGSLTLTYGLCSNDLLLQIKKKSSPGIAPQLDQHAGYEVNSRGNRICKRDGFACDFYVVGIDSLTVAQWIVENLPFDRLYFYGKDRPLHVSIAPENNYAITLLEQAPSERRIPKNIKKNAFLLKE